ncbi:MAG: homocysteine biosynthesis protein [bacterium]
MSTKTYEEINEKIRQKKAVVVTAEEVISMVEEKGLKKTAQEVDVVTTGTFGPMCSSGAFLNIGHSKPKIKIQKAWLNDINAYAGLAAVDLYIGATEIPDSDPGTFEYGGGHVIEDLLAGKDVKLKAIAYGTDCYPRKELKTLVNLKDINQAVLTNPRNSYQNYNCAINLGEKTIYTYMGTLKGNAGNANYCSAGQLSPLLKDPFYKTIGIGTRIFLAGAQGYVYWEGTQHSPTAKRGENGVPRSPAGTIAVVGNLKEMSTRYLKGATFVKYGTTIIVGIGIPIPILSEEILKYAAIPDKDIYTQIVDYSRDYPQGVAQSHGEVNYAQLKSGKITFKGREVPTVPLSSYAMAREIAGVLQSWIREGRFFLSAPARTLDLNDKFKPLIERPFE